MNYERLLFVHDEILRLWPQNGVVYAVLAMLSRSEASSLRNYSPLTSDQILQDPFQNGGELRVNLAILSEAKYLVTASRLPTDSQVLRTES